MTWVEVGAVELIELNDFPLEDAQAGPARSRAWKHRLPDDPEEGPVWLVVTVWVYPMAYDPLTDSPNGLQAGQYGIRQAWDTAVTTTPNESGVGELWSDSRYCWGMKTDGTVWTSDSAVQADVGAGLEVDFLGTRKAAQHAQIVAPHILGL